MITLALAVDTSDAGDRWNVRGMGMARTLVATARGVDAIGINPANLARSDRGSFTLNLFPVGLSMSSDLISYDIYNEYFTGVPDGSGSRQPKYLSNEDKQKILDAFPGNESTTRFDLESMLIGFGLRSTTFGGIGFGVIERVGARMILPEDYVRMLLSGLDSTGSKYVFDRTNFSAWWWREYNFSFGTLLPRLFKVPQEFYVGVGVKLLQGYGSFETEHYRASIANERVDVNQYRANLAFDYLTKRAGIDLLDENKDADISLSPDPAGSGVGFDFGLAADFGFLNLHASITDVGSIKWNKNIVETYGQYDLVIDDPFSDVNTDSIESALRGKNRKGENYSTSLPTTLRIGVAIFSDRVEELKAIPGKFIFALDYTQGLNASMGNVTTPRISGGIEYRLIPFLPLRTGLSIGDGQGVRWGAGLGLDFYYWELNIASENFGFIFSPNNFDMFSVAFGMRIRV